MSENLISKRAFCILNGLSGIVGVALISLSFDINPGPPPGATSAALMEFGRQHYASILWAAWLQAVGPVLIVLFAFALVHLAGATQRLLSRGCDAHDSSKLLSTSALCTLTRR